MAGLWEGEIGKVPDPAAAADGSVPHSERDKEIGWHEGRHSPAELNIK